MSKFVEEASVKDEIFPLDPVKFNTSDSILLDSLSASDSQPLATLLEARQSRRDLSTISIQELGPLFYLSSRSKYSQINDIALKVEKRNIPSCGALHTISCVVSKFNSDDWYLYNPYSHSFDKLIVDVKAINGFKRECQELINTRAGFLIWYVCDFERLSCKYKHAESLALRESGVISATQNLLAEDMGFKFCMLGLSGFEHAVVLSEERRLLGVGAAAIG